MLVLLDENLPRALVTELTGHDVSTTVRAEGWSGAKNGELLRLARERFDALLTLDRGLQHQQNLGVSGIRVVIIRAPSNRMADLRPLVGSILKALDAPPLGQVLEVEG